MPTELRMARVLGGPRIAVVVALVIAAYFLAATTYTREEAHAIGDAAVGMGQLSTPSINALAAARHHLQRVAFLLQEEVDAPAVRVGRSAELQANWRALDGDLRRYETLPTYLGERALWPDATRAADELDGLRLRLDAHAVGSTRPTADDVYATAHRLDAALEAVIRFDVGYERRLAGTIGGLNARITREDVGLDAIGGLLAAVLAFFAWWSSTRFERLRDAHQHLREVRAAEAERSEARLRAVLDQCPVGIVVQDAADSARVEVNVYAARLLGIARASRPAPEEADVLVGPAGETIAADEQPRARAMRGERVERLELAARHASGLLVPVMVNAAPIDDPAGARLGAVVALEDITHLKQIEQLRTEWNAIVAHDLRQPLAAINAGARMLATPDEPAQRTADIVRRSVQRLNRMINDLLDLSRLEAHRLPLQRRELDPSEAVHAAVDHVALQSPDRRFDVRIASSLPRVDADRSRLDQVLENLLTNAVKYGDAACEIVVDVRAHADGVEVAVTNQGAGIAPDDVPLLFQRFGIPRHAPSAAGSVGLGLYIVRELVEAHGGRVGVRSTPGGATTFWFTLPRANEATQVAEA